MIGVAGQSCRYEEWSGVTVRSVTDNGGRTDAQDLGLAGIQRTAP
jgi:hypothetical protein